MKDKWHQWRGKTLVGGRFGGLTVLSQDRNKHTSGHSNTRWWICQCDCGKQTSVPTCRLTNGNTKSCGCRWDKSIHGQLAGKKFGKLTVLNPIGERRATCLWECKCDCGKTKNVRSCELIRKAVRSCGCLKSGGKLDFAPGEALCNIVIRMYSDNAKKINIPFELSKESMIKLFAGHCYYCGCAPSRTRRRANRPGEFTYNGIDRVDNSKGYTDSNVVSCCTTCNMKKGSMSQKEFLAWIHRVAINRPVC